MRTAILLLLALAAPALVSAQSNEAATQGSEIVGRACQGCHGNIVRMLRVEHRSAAQWRNTIFSMIGRGAHIFPDEIEPLVAYLAASHGPVNAPAPQPSAGTRVPPASAARALPDGAGRPILERACQQCHDLETSMKKPAARDWSATVRAMATYGAAITPAEEKTLVEYLGRLAP
jgi:cytochrome c5